MGSVLASIVSITSNAPVALGSNTVRSSLSILNNGSASVYVGGSAVTYLTGMPLAVGATISIDVPQSTSIYAIGSNTATHELRLLEVAP